LEITSQGEQISRHERPNLRHAASGGSVNVALTIAGSDSGGGAGIQADLKTFHQFGVFGTSVITAVTAQNTVGVRAWDALSAKLIAAQVDAVAEDLPPQAFKTGMLGTAEAATAVADAIGRHALTNYVLDPVMVATSGDRLLDPDAERVIVERLVPMALLVTPNLDEAVILAGFPVRTVADMERAAQVMLERGAQAALIKGGHLAGDDVVDVFATAGTARRFTRRRIHTRGGHGTGCTLSAAIAAGLASGEPLATAVSQGLDFVHRALAAAPALGRGSGPLNHFVEARLRR
jgi:hydroxymethylpyrimidine/phosphomethylpyrimidine kinase